MAEALVAGHICLDIIPEFKGTVSFDPGRLIEIGKATLSTGGVVSNTGLALHRLGVDTSLCGKVGDDLFGTAVTDLLNSKSKSLADGMTVAPGEQTSYSVVISLSGEDRMFLHAPGCNDTFLARDVSDHALAEAKLVHFGYPTLMAQMYANGGCETVELFKRAKRLGATTSLDMSLPDLSGAAAKADWHQILTDLLPYTDLFLPNVEELQFMLDRSSFQVDQEPLSRKKISLHVQKAHRLGAKVVGVKAGSRGLYLSASSSLSDMGRATPSNVSGWQGAKVWSPCFLVDVVGTTGAGDATAAGLLMAWLRSFSPEEAARAATAVGACCCEAADATSGIRSWESISSRIANGWQSLDID